jgi:hypothetical protein
MTEDPRGGKGLFRSVGPLMMTMMMMIMAVTMGETAGYDFRRQVKFKLWKSNTIYNKDYFCYMDYKTWGQTRNLRTVLTTRSHKTSTSSYVVDRLGKTNEKHHLLQVTPMEVTPCKMDSVLLMAEALHTKRT